MLKAHASRLAGHGTSPTPGTSSRPPGDRFYGRGRRYPLLRAYGRVPARPAAAQPQQQRPHDHLSGRPAGHSSRDLQQRTLHFRPVHASGVFRPVGTDRVGLPKDMRKGPFLVRATAPPELVDQEGLRLGLQSVRLQVRQGTSQERLGLDASAADEQHFWQDRGGRRRQEEEAPQPQLPALPGHLREPPHRDGSPRSRRQPVVLQHRLLLTADVGQRAQCLPSSCPFQEEVEDRIAREDSVSLDGSR